MDIQPAKAQRSPLGYVLISFVYSLLVVGAFTMGAFVVVSVFLWKRCLPSEGGLHKCVLWFMSRSWWLHTLRGVAAYAAVFLRCYTQYHLLSLHNLTNRWFSIAPSFCCVEPAARFAWQLFEVTQSASHNIASGHPISSFVIDMAQEEPCPSVTLLFLKREKHTTIWTSPVPAGHFSRHPQGDIQGLSKCQPNSIMPSSSIFQNSPIS